MTPMPSTRSAADTLRSIEERADKAIVQELRLMIQTILDMRSQLLLDDRAHADALLLKLDRLRCDQVVEAPASPAESAPHAPERHRPNKTPDGSANGVMTALTGHTLHCYDPEHGILQNSLTVPGFMEAIRHFQERVPASVDCMVVATWCHGQVVRGELTARTVQGIVVAHITPIEDGAARAGVHREANRHGTVSPLMATAGPAMAEAA